MSAVFEFAPLETPRTTWTPVLDPSEAEQAFGIVRDILREADVATDPSLCCGSSGLAVLHGYAALAGLTGNGGDRAVELIDHAGAVLAKRPTMPWLAEGFSGVAWAAAHLEREGMIPERRGRYEQIDAALETLLSDASVGKYFELLYGIVGLGVYALERLPDPNARRLLGLVLDRLEESAERTRDGVTWRTTDGSYNLGVSHGVPGVIGFLAALCAAGVERRRAKALLTPAVVWLRSQRLPRDLPAWFPNVANGTHAEPSRAAWCYGDPGIAATLFMVAADGNGLPWRDDALAVARLAARRPPEECGVLDAGFCHGAAGLGHLFNRMYQATPAAIDLGRAARFWLLRAMELCVPGEGVAGYRSLTAPDGTAIWKADAGLLTGATGVALALLAGACEVEPNWDRALLVSCRRT
jgi:hypothetical protein